MLRRVTIPAFLLAVFTCGPASLTAAEKLDKRWLYLQTNLQVAENVPKTSDLLRRAAKAGYNGVVLADYKLNILDRVPDHLASRTP